MYRVIFFKDLHHKTNDVFLATDKSDKYFSDRYELTTFAQNLTFDEACDIAGILNKRIQK